MTINDVMLEFTQPKEVFTGGIHTPPECRLLMYALAKAARANMIVETGYDAGYTTMALAETGAEVWAVDNLSEYAIADVFARPLLAPYPKVTLHLSDALVFIKGLEDESVDLIFVDDNHDYDHVEKEAIEVKRILRPGGIALFHDVLEYEKIGKVIFEVFSEWQVMMLPCVSPVFQRDFGLGLVRKPVMEVA